MLCSGRRVLNTGRNMEPCPHPLQTKGLLSSKMKLACLSLGSRDVPPAGFEGCLSSVDSDPTPMSFQVHIRTVSFCRPPIKVSETSPVRFMPQLCSCEQGCLLFFMCPAGKGKCWEMRKEGCVGGFTALALHLTARLKCCSGFCNCPGSHSHESASLSLKSRRILGRSQPRVLQRLLQSLLQFHSRRVHVRLP